jgi:hypothetical protein
MYVYIKYNSSDEENCHFYKICQSSFIKMLVPRLSLSVLAAAIDSSLYRLSLYKL